MEGRQHNQCRTTYPCTYLCCINRKMTLYVIRAPRSHQVNSFLIHLPIFALGWVEPEYDIPDLLYSPYVILHKKTNLIVDVLFIKHKSNFNKACLPSSIYSSGLHCLFLSSGLVVSYCITREISRYFLHLCQNSWATTLSATAFTFDICTIDVNGTISAHVFLIWLTVSGSEKFAREFEPFTKAEIYVKRKIIAFIRNQ